MFVDVAKIFVKGGDGGKGVVSFRREKFIPHGGPDGGDGGDGGNVIIKADSSMNTLLDFKYKKKYEAERGTDGMGKKMKGRDGKDLIISVPVGTIIKDVDGDRIIADLVEDGQTKIIAKGGRGGKGNIHFATSTRRAPRISQDGEKGEERWIILELKTIADVGLIGFPNVGKSTILSVITAARPKIANYHFTTLEPNLGVVELKGDRSFILADIPGLIEGAHQGVGLGHDFLRHIERTRLLLHIIDVSGIEGRDPISDYEKINEELVQYSPKLAEKPQIVVGNKYDLPGASTNARALESYLAKKGVECFFVSAARHEGFDALLEAVWRLLETIPMPQLYVETDEELNVQRIDKTAYEIYVEDGIFIVQGPFVDELMRKVNLDDYDSLQYFQRAIQKRGVVDALKEKGVKDGDTVRMNDLEFEFVE
ncbi:MAG TPA: GTPase ObgE [Clostridiales bacterium]|nr:GTPase ObgE [Clostridiales bacterium]